MAVGANIESSSGGIMPSTHGRPRRAGGISLPCRSTTQEGCRRETRSQLLYPPVIDGLSARRVGSGAVGREECIQPHDLRPRGLPIWLWGGAGAGRERPCRFPPAFPEGEGPAYPCPPPQVDALRPGARLTANEIVLLDGPRVRAQLEIGGRSLVTYVPIEVFSRPTILRLTKPDPPQLTLARVPAVHARIIPGGDITGGRLHYMWVTECPPVAGQPSPVGSAYTSLRWESLPWRGGTGYTFNPSALRPCSGMVSPDGWGILLFVSTTVSSGKRVPTEEPTLLASGLVPNPQSDDYDCDAPGAANVLNALRATWPMAEST